MSFATEMVKLAAASTAELADPYIVGIDEKPRVARGSGILSIIAAKLGAKEVWGIDIDDVAVENARENVKQNNVSDIVRIRKGRIGDIHKEFDLVVANIDFNNLKRMRWSLLRHLRSQGFLILSGILEEEIERDFVDTTLGQGFFKGLK
jgi:ribosomal protein L11 methyltransferase